MVLDWSRAGLSAVNDVLTHYSERMFEKLRLLYGFERVESRSA
jgi:hypothetical protein